MFKDLDSLNTWANIFLTLSVFVAFYQYREDVRQRGIDTSIRLIDKWDELMDKEQARTTLDKVMLAFRNKADDGEFRSVCLEIYKNRAHPDLDKQYLDMHAILNMFEEITYFYTHRVGDQVFIGANFAPPILRYMAALQTFVEVVRTEKNTRSWAPLMKCVKAWREIDWDSTERKGRLLKRGWLLSNPGWKVRRIVIGSIRKLRVRGRKYGLLK